jgi:hypothetical protein
LLKQRKHHRRENVQSVYNLICKGHIPQKLSPNPQNSNNKKSWIVSPTDRTSSNTHNTNKPSTNNWDSISMEYNIVDDLKKIKENI